MGINLQSTQPTAARIGVFLPILMLLLLPQISANRMLAEFRTDPTRTGTVIDTCPNYRQKMIKDDSKSKTQEFVMDQTDKSLNIDAYNF